MRPNGCAVVTDRERTVRSFDHLDPGTGVAGPLWARQELQWAPAAIDRVVPRDRPGMAEGEDGALVEHRIERAVGRLGLCRLDPEAGIEARQEAVEHFLDLGDHRRAGVTQLGHEPVLERAG